MEIKSTEGYFITNWMGGKLQKDSPRVSLITICNWHWQSFTCRGFKLHVPLSNPSLKEKPWTLPGPVCAQRSVSHSTTRQSWLTLRNHSCGPWAQGAHSLVQGCYRTIQEVQWRRWVHRNSSAKRQSGVRGTPEANSERWTEIRQQRGKRMVAGNIPGSRATETQNTNEQVRTEAFPVL